MTKELIEEARPDKLTAEEAVKLVLKRPGMYGLTRTDEFRKVEAERDTALAAVERAKALVAEWQNTGAASGPFPERTVIDVDEEVIAPLLAALDGAPEPEWEYQRGEPGESFIGFDGYATFEEAASEMRDMSEFDSHRVMRRRKAGPWLPVEGESSDE